MKNKLQLDAKLTWEWGYLAGQSFNYKIKSPLKRTGLEFFKIIWLDA